VNPANFESQMTLSLYKVSQDRLAFQKGMKKSKVGKRENCFYSFQLK
jgi:hypothetical protein